MADLTQNINVKITADDSKFRAAAKSSEKAVSDLEKKSSSDLKKMASNFAGMFSDKGKDTGIGQFIGEITEGTGALSAFAGPAAIVTGAVVGMGAAAVTTGAALFSLAKSASDYGSEIADAQSKTGLTAESLSSLRYQANLSGSDFGQVSGAISKFSKLVGDAAKGSDEAKGKLKALGIDPKDAINDLDGALGQAFKTINDAKPGVDQINASFDAFGKKGPDLIPTIRGMNGNFGELKKQAESLGLVLREEDVQAADAFGDTLDTLKMQAQGAANEFAFGFMPKITNAMHIISGDLKNNKDVWREWGEFIGEKLELATRNMNLYIAAAKSLYEYKTIGMSVSLPAWLAQDKENQYLSNFRKSIADNTKNTMFKDMFGDIDKLGRKLSIDAAADDSYLGNAGKVGKSKKEKTEAQKVTWNAAQMAEFTRNQGFIPGDGYRADGKGHNDGSAHYGNRALDVKLGSSDPNRTVPEIVRLMENSIKAGMRVVDERIKPRPNAKWKGAHVHLEENDNKASFFNPNLDYGGKLEYLKALDAKRLKGESQLLADSLGKTNTKVDEGAKLFEDYNKKVRALGVSSERGRVDLELEGKQYANLDPEIRKAIQLKADEIDSFEARSKASDDYSGFLDKLSGEYDDLTGATSSATKELGKQLDALRDAGVVLDLTSESAARLKAFNVDFIKTEKELFAAESQMNDARRESRDYMYEQAEAARILRNEFALATALPGRKPTLEKGTGTADAFVLPSLDDGSKAPKMKTTVDGYWGAYGEAKNKAEQEGGIFDPDSLSVQMDALAEFKDTAMDAFGGITQGLGAMLEAWITTGELSGQAVLKMTASVIAGVASQAAVKSIFEAAEGFAALAVGNAPGAALHFTSAKIYGAVALAATAAGLGLGAVTGGSGGKKDKSSGASSDKSPSDYLKENSSDDRRMNFLRQSQSDQARNQIEYKRELSMISESIDNLNGKIGSMRPGDVLTAGANQKPGFIAERTVSELGKNSTLAGQMGRRLNL